MDAVVAYGEPLVDDPGRIGQPVAIGLDETLSNKTGPFRTPSWTTAIVDVANPRLLDLVEGRDSSAPCAWWALARSLRTPTGGSKRACGQRRTDRAVRAGHRRRVQSHGNRGGSPLRSGHEPQLRQLRRHRRRPPVVCRWPRTRPCDHGSTNHQALSMSGMPSGIGIIQPLTGLPNFA
jgi:hypothetical protein